MAGIHQLLTTFVGPGQVWIVARIGLDDHLDGDQVESLYAGLSLV